MACELVIFPIMCGWMLDVATLDFFGVTMASRLVNLMQMPIVSTALHWYAVLRAGRHTDLCDAHVDWRMHARVAATLLCT